MRTGKADEQTAERLGLTVFCVIPNDTGMVLGLLLFRKAHGVLHPLPEPPPPSRVMGSVSLGDARDWKRMTELPTLCDHSSWPNPISSFSYKLTSSSPSGENMPQREAGRGVGVSTPLSRIALALSAAAPPPNRSYSLA